MVTYFIEHHQEGEMILTYKNSDGALTFPYFFVSEAYALQTSLNDIPYLPAEHRKGRLSKFQSAFEE